MKIHYVEYSGQKDLLISCLKKWTEPTWHKDTLPKVPEDVFWAEPIYDLYIKYTFAKENTTCEDCLKLINTNNY
jgi:hypothetical protein